MAQRYILTVTATNRVGILAAVSTAVDELGGDMREINQSVVQHCLTATLAADFPEHRDPQVIVDHVRDMGHSFGLEVVLRDCVGRDDDSQSASRCETYWFSLTGRNQPGVLRRIATHLSQQGIDVVNLHGTRECAGNEFALRMELSMPSEIDPSTLARQLEHLDRSFGLSVAVLSQAACAPEAGSGSGD